MTKDERIRRQHYAYKIEVVWDTKLRKFKYVEIPWPKYLVEYWMVYVKKYGYEDQPSISLPCLYLMSLPDNILDFDFITEVKSVSLSMGKTCGKYRTEQNPLQLFEDVATVSGAMLGFIKDTGLVEVKY